MKKLFTTLLILVILTLSIFAQPIVTLNKELSTPSQNMVIDENGLINGAKVVYDITTEKEIKMTDLGFVVYGPINNISLKIGSVIIASKNTSHKTFLSDLNINIPANNKIKLEVYLSYEGISIGGYSSGSTAQIQMTQISYMEGPSGIGMDVEDTGLSPLMCLVSKLPELSIEGRPVGANTYITIPLNVVGEGIIDRLQLSVKYLENHFMPFDFWVSSIFYGYDNSWILPSSYFDGDKLNFAAVGNTVYLYNQEKLGTFKMFISDNVKNNEITSNISMFDGVNIWKNNISPFKVINLKMKEYNDLNNDSKYDVNDSRAIFDMLGTKPNDIDMVKGDLNGDGMLLTYDTYLSLNIAMNPNSFYDLPIFSNNNASGKIVPKDPIVINWKKLSNGQYGAFASEKITNGDFIIKSKVSRQIGMFKQDGEKAFFVDINPSINTPILISDKPTKIIGTVNEGREIIVSPFVTTTVEENNEIPTEFKLEQNYPNPFNPSTTISYQIPQNGFVTLKVYDVIGREIAELVNQEKSAGRYEVNFNASKLASGMYIYKLTGNNINLSKKMMLIK